MALMRLDLALVEKYGFTRNKARQLIESGLVSFQEKLIQKPAFDVNDLGHIQMREDKRIHWVSRSAKKLEGFFEKFNIQYSTFNIAGTCCLDVGSSTGGFTQVLLEHGVRHIDAVDVGTDQLHHSLRDDPRVTSYEQTDIRDFTPKSQTSQDSHNPEYDIIVCDASFISLLDIIDAILSLAGEHTEIILLYKPQFEVGAKNLRKTGVPKNEKCILESMKRFESYLSEK
jgi:23S rRNA (cytidine1920-2'-O)/16S rRNA (cytidine1409-2'-O)-methyltransferase